MIDRLRAPFACALTAVLLIAATVVAQPGTDAVPTIANTGSPSPRQPSDIVLDDLPSDDGSALVVTWSKDVDAPLGTFYEVTVSLSPNGPFYPAVQTTRDAPLISEDRGTFGWFYPNGNRQFAILDAYEVPAETEDGSPTRKRIDSGVTYYVQFSTLLGGARVELAEAMRGAPMGNLFRINKLNNLIFALFFAAIILIFIELARRNPNMYIRKIAGLDAVEEALGRATEMGKPVYFVHGLESMSHVSTIAAVNVLGRVARRAFEYDTTLKVMNNDPIVLAVSRAVVQQSAVEVGRPDSYNEDDVMFVASAQFSYAAAVDGLMVRERPATVLLMGYFYAESLLFAETGSHIGAIQIAGSDAYTQLPFFITTCDYTLMGEELYAASAYLAREPRLLGSLRGQDVGKASILAVLILGTLLELFGIPWIANLVMPM
jgi:hypothetical protein